MSLIKLRQFQTISDKNFLDAFNALLLAADANFEYTLNEVATPLPNLSFGQVNNVVSVGIVNSQKVLQYSDPHRLIGLQTLLNGFLANNSTLTANKEFELLINSPNATFAKFKLTARNRFGTGTIKNQISVNQVSNEGDLTEEHTVNTFIVNANTVAINSAAAPLQVNSLQIGSYKFPTALGTVNQVLRMGANNTLEFADIQEAIQSTETYYALKETKPLLFTGNAQTPVIGFNNLTAGIFVSPLNTSTDPTLTLKYNKQEVFNVIGPGAPATTYIKFNIPVLLPSTQSLNDSTAREGSLWYDSLNKALTLITGNGRLSIKGQAIAATVNTEEAKTFTMQPSASLALGGGSETAPSLKIGSAGIAAVNGNLKIIVNSTPAFKVTETGIESNNNATGSAKIVLSDTLGINNPSNPAYSFSGANKLGMYRAGSDSIGISVKGTSVAEFKDTGLDVKNTRITNIAPPTDNKDAVNKEYVDSKVPTGTTLGAVPIVETGGRYGQSDLRYFNSKLEVGATNANGAIALRTATGGSVTIRPSGGNQHTSFSLPSNTFANGLLQLKPNGTTEWIDKNTLVAGLVKENGSTVMSGGIKVGTATSKDNLLIGVNTVGFYASAGSNPKLGLAAENQNMLEIDVKGKILKGVGTTFNAPLIRLDSTLASYTGTAGSVNPTAIPTYAFAGEQNTGIGQTMIHGVSMVVMGSAKLTANEVGISAHGNRIQNASLPVASTDVATKEYVDKVVKVPVEVSFRITSLPVGYSTTGAVILSLYDKALIVGSNAAVMVHESAVDPASVVIPSNFNVNAKCQAFINNVRLVKMAATSGVRQIAYLTNRSLLINYSPLNVGDIITVQIGE